MKRKKILLLAFAISPTRGSEHSVAWNYVINMSKDNELVVLYGESGYHIGDLNEMDEYLKNNSIDNVRFIAIKPNRLTNIFNTLNKRNILVFTFYIAYKFWHKQAYRVAKDLIKSEHFDLIHYLGPNGYREPGYLWKINLPYIWGPVGGFRNRPKELFKALNNKSKIIFSLRNCINTIQFKYNTRLKRAFDNTDLLLTTTTQNQMIVQNYYNKHSIYIPENGISDPVQEVLIQDDKFKKDSLINIFWIGRIDANKSLNTLLTALSKVNCSNWHLHVIGEGVLRNKMEELSTQLKIESRISWHGHVLRSEVFSLLKIAHLTIITSLGEGNPTTIWEAMSAGVPTISLDHCGMHDTICEKCGVKIPINSYNQVINDLAFQLDRLISSPDELLMLSKGVIECSKKYTWDQRREFFNKMYELAIENWKNKDKIK